MKEIIITSSVLILCIMLIRILFRGKISSRLQYALWLLVALRLVIPASAQIYLAIGSMEEFRIMDIVEWAEERWGSAEEQLEQPVSFSVGLNNGLSRLAAGFVLGEELSDTDGATSIFLAGKSMFSWLDVIRGIWVGGMAVAATWIAATNMVFRRKLHSSRKEFVMSEESEQMMQAIYKKMARKSYFAGGQGETRRADPACSKAAISMDRKQRREKKKIRIYTVERLASPCLYGLPGREAVYLTRDVAEDPDKLRHVLTHEICHQMQGDSFWSIVRAALIVVYWMNPLVWVAAVLSKRDCEIACDERALLLLGEEERIPYGETLISIITRRGRMSDIACTATTMTGSGKNVKERIKYIASSPRVMGAAVVTVLLLVMVISVLVFTRNPVFSGYRWEGEIVLSVGDMQIRLPESIAGLSGYRTEGEEKDIIIYHVASGREVGRFRVLTYQEAKALADQGVSITPLGNYGQNGYLKEQPMHSYTPASGSEGVPGTDSNEETVYILEEEDWMSSDEWEVMPLEETMDYQPDEKGAEMPHEYLPDEQMTGGAAVELPAEEIITSQIVEPDPGGKCYVYVKADYADVRQKYLEEMEYINSELEAVTGQVIVLSANQLLREELFAVLAENRTAYLGDATKTSTLAGALPNPKGLAYKGVTLHTLQTEPETGLSLEIDYELTADTSADVDSDVVFFNAVMIFATIKNVDQCSFVMDDDNVSYERVEMETELGTLWSEEADEADTYEEWLEGLWVRVSEYLKSNISA